MMSARSNSESTPDRRIRAEIMVQLAATPETRGADIHVSVNDGVVTLTGMISEISQRIAASDTVLRVTGVSAVVDELTESER